MTDAPDADGRTDPNAPTERRGVVIAFPGARTATAAAPAPQAEPDESWRKRIARAERERIGRILAHPKAVGNERLAFYMAIYTDKTLAEAGQILAALRHNAEDLPQDLTIFDEESFANYLPPTN